MPPISIVHLDTDRVWRGGQQSLLTLARGLRDLGHEQLIVCPAVSELAERAVAGNFTVVALTGSRDLRMLFRRASIDIVHAHSGRAQNLAYLSSLGTSVRRVVTRHVAFAPSNSFLHRLKYNLTSDAIVAVSEAVRNVLVSTGVEAAKIEVIHTGVEVPESLPARRKDAHFVVGHMGAFTAEKGQDVAIQAAALLQDRAPRLRMSLAGEGPLLETLRRNAPPNVLFPGFVTDPAGFYAALDLFIMPSRSEAWGLAALDAMAHGVPVIASNIGGLAEMVDWLVPAGDPQALAEAIFNAMSKDPEQLRAIGLAGRERAREFSGAKTAKRTQALYRRILDRA